MSGGPQETLIYNEAFDCTCSTRGSGNDIATICIHACQFPALGRSEHSGRPCGYYRRDRYGPGGPVSISLVGNSEEARQTVAKLVAGMGLEPIDVGPVKQARYLEGMLIL